jgi:hypothetical protein
MAKNSAGFPIIALVVTALSGWMLTGCSTIGTTPKYAAGTTRLTPKPDHIYITPFDTEKGAWFVDKTDSDLIDFKRSFSEDFQQLLRKRLQNIAPVDTTWNEIPKTGWLVVGEFTRVDQGSRFLRSAVGVGVGRTTLRTRVYVYDLSISSEKYILSFETGKAKAEGSPKSPSGLTTLGEPITTTAAITSGLSWDSGKTAMAIEDFLAPYQ